MEAAEDAAPALPFCANLAELQPVSLKVIVAGTDEARRWAHSLEHHHYLGLRVVGENLGYLAIDRFGRD
jgi:hypothetical protein